MLDLLRAFACAFLAVFRPCVSLVGENLALRQQIGVLLRGGHRPRLRWVDPAFSVALSRVWSRWRELLAIVKPATVIAWHRRGFARFWANRSRRMGRPAISKEIIDLIVRMAQ